jgi:hypothetical protein
MESAGERRLTDSTKHWELPAMKRKKGLSALLAFAMVIGCLTTLFPASAYAAEPSSSGRGAESAALTVKDRSGNVLGDTLYWHNWKNYMHYESLNRLQEVRLRADFSPKSTVAGAIGEGNDLYAITLFNDSSAPAVQTRIRTISSATREDILPAFYSDNYFSLMPGESKTVTVEFNPKYLKGARPVFELSGWNTKAETINRTQNRK